MELTLPLEDQVLQFTILVVIAFAVQLAFRRLPAPGLIGLLIVGMLIGPGGAGILPDEPVVELLGTIGLLWIMFLAGLEIDLPVVRQHKREAAGFGVLGFGLCFALALAAGLLFGLEWAGALLLAAALSSHTLISYPIIQASGLIHRRPMVAAVGGTLLTDTAALIVLVVVLQVAGAEDGALGWAGPIVLLAAIAAGAFVLVPRISHYVLERSGASRAESALYVVAVLVALASLAELIGTEDILGAFIAGLCLNRALKGREVLAEHLVFAGRMLFIPAFFVQTGMLLDLEVFGDPSIWAMAAVLCLVVVLGKGGAAWGAARAFGYGRVDRLAMTGLTIPQAAATLAVVTTAHGAGLIDIDVVDAVIVVIFVTCLAGAIATRRAARQLTTHDPAESPESERA
jgi:Kef-type K+ transport system membrane component KefB